MKIYKIIKPNDPMTIYIGRTIQSLKRRMQKHASDSKNSHLKVYKWYDNTCEIELIEDYIGNTPGIREMEIVQEYISDGYTVMNTQIGKHSLDPVGNSKLISAKTNARNNPKNNPIYNAKKHPDYATWTVRICQKAKKEGLTSKEYRKKYNLEYLGQKTK
jgi:hypothetical protein